MSAKKVPALKDGEATPEDAASAGFGTDASMTLEERVKRARLQRESGQADRTVVADTVDVADDRTVTHVSFESKLAAARRQRARVLSERRADNPAGSRDAPGPRPVATPNGAASTRLKEALGLDTAIAPGPTPSAATATIAQASRSGDEVTDDRATRHGPAEAPVDTGRSDRAARWLPWRVAGLSAVAASSLLGAIVTVSDLVLSPGESSMTSTVSAGSAAPAPNEIASPGAAPTSAGATPLDLVVIVEEGASDAQIRWGDIASDIRRTRFAVDRSTVEYFNAADERTATELAAEVGAEVVDLSHIRPALPVGRIVVRLASDDA